MTCLTVPRDHATGAFDNSRSRMRTAAYGMENRTRPARVPAPVE